MNRQIVRASLVRQLRAWEYGSRRHPTQEQLAEYDIKPCGKGHLGCGQYRTINGGCALCGDPCL